MSNAPASSTRRALCASCLRPAKACICAAIQRVELARTQVLILMHPDEVGHAKNTGQLLHLCLPQNSRMLVGETFEAAGLQDALYAAWTEQQAPHRVRLLYPENGNLASESSHPEPDITRLVIIDATWRKSRQMIALNPALQNLPRLSLQNMAASRYAIRKAHEPHQLSTLEATQLALQQLEPGNPHISHLGAAMDAFIALQRPFWPHAQD